MSVSMDTGLGYMDVGKTVPLNGPVGQEPNNLSFQSIAEQEDETRKRSKVGLPFPGQLSQEEEHRIEQLKGQAMQIASQAEDGLTVQQEAQIKSIEQEISKVSGMPMSEDLSSKAKHVAEQNKLEARQMDSQESALKTQEGEFDAFGAEMSDGNEGPGMAMLKRNALVTSIKGMGAGMSGFRGKA